MGMLKGTIWENVSDSFNETRIIPLHFGSLLKEKLTDPKFIKKKS